MDTAQSQQQLRQTSEDEVTRRGLEHQAAVDRIRQGSTRRALSAGAAARPAQLDFLAIGDSWFEYPLSDEGLPVPFWNAAVVGSNQLQSMGGPPPLINSIALHGESAGAIIPIPAGITRKSLMSMPFMFMSAASHST